MALTTLEELHTSGATDRVGKNGISASRDFLATFDADTPYPLAEIATTKILKPDSLEIDVLHPDPDYANAGARVVDYRLLEKLTEQKYIVEVVYLTETAVAGFWTVRFGSEVFIERTVLSFVLPGSDVEPQLIGSHFYTELDSDSKDAEGNVQTATHFIDDISATGIAKRIELVQQTEGTRTKEIDRPKALMTMTFNATLLNWNYDQVRTLYSHQNTVNLDEFEGFKPFTLLVRRVALDSDVQPAFFGRSTQRFPVSIEIIEIGEPFDPLTLFETFKGSDDVDRPVRDIDDGDAVRRQFANYGRSNFSNMFQLATRSNRRVGARIGGGILP